MKRNEWLDELHLSQDGAHLLDRYDREDRYHGALNQQAESLLQSLKPGTNPVTSYQFRVLVRYIFWEQDESAKAALKSGTVRMSGYTIVDSSRPVVSLR